MYFYLYKWFVSTPGRQLAIFLLSSSFSFICKQNLWLITHNFTYIYSDAWLYLTPTVLRQVNNLLLKYYSCEIFQENS